MAVNKKRYVYKKREEPELRRRMLHALGNKPLAVLAEGLGLEVKTLTHWPSQGIPYNRREQVSAWIEAQHGNG